MIYSGKNFIIRNWRNGDESFLAHNANNKNIWKFMDDEFPFPYTYDDAIYFVESNLKNNFKIFNFALVVDDDPVGNIELIKGEGVYRNSVEIKFWIGEEYWGQGVLTEAIEWLVSYSFNEYVINRIVAQVFSNNEAAKKVLLKNDFILEATLKNAIYKDGSVLNELIYSVLR